MRMLLNGIWPADLPAAAHKLQNRPVTPDAGMRGKPSGKMFTGSGL